MTASSVINHQIVFGVCRPMIVSTRMCDSKSTITRVPMSSFTFFAEAPKGCEIPKKSFGLPIENFGCSGLRGDESEEKFKRHRSRLTLILPRKRREYTPWCLDVLHRKSIFPTSLLTIHQHLFVISIHNQWLELPYRPRSFIGNEEGPRSGESLHRCR